MNLIENIYDSVKDHIELHMNDYIEDYDAPEIQHVYREYVDIYELPMYPSIVMGYGQITMKEEHTTTSEHWNVPISIYAVTSGLDSTTVQKHVEAYSFILFSIFSGEDFNTGIVNITGMGVSPALARQNNLVQVGYIDLEIDVSVKRKQR